jgi:hypothetical protein
MPLYQPSPQRHPQQGNTAKKTATRDRLPAQVFTRGTTGAVTVKTHASEGTSVTHVSSLDEHSRSSRSQTRDPRERSPRPPRTRRRSSSARRTNDERVQGRSVRSGDSDYRHHVPHADSSSDQGSAASPASHSRGRRTPSHGEPRDSPSIQKPTLQKPGSRDSSPAPSLESQKLHVKETKKVIDGTFQSRSRVNPLIAVDRCLR